MENKEIEQNKKTTESKNNTGCGIALAIFIVFVIICYIFGVSDKSKPKYSNDYYNDKSYRDNVNDVADAYGKDAYEVDKMIQSIEKEMNK